jgi:hypothetical protein
MKQRRGGSGTSTRRRSNLPHGGGEAGQSRPVLSGIVPLGSTDPRGLRVDTALGGVGDLWSGDGASRPMVPSWRSFGDPMSTGVGAWLLFSYGAWGRRLPDARRVAPGLSSLDVERRVVLEVVAEPSRAQLEHRLR